MVFLRIFVISLGYWINLYLKELIIGFGLTQSSYFVLFYCLIPVWVLFKSFSFLSTSLKSYIFLLVVRAVSVLLWDRVWCSSFASVQTMPNTFTVILTFPSSFRLQDFCFTLLLGRSLGISDIPLLVHHMDRLMPAGPDTQACTVTLVGTFPGSRKFRWVHKSHEYWRDRLAVHGCL